MKIIITWNNEDSKKLFNTLNLAIWEIWLEDFIKTEESNDENLKTELNITKEPALVIVEESIDFKDMIFEGIVPESSELKSMIISIVWWGWWSCSSGCSWCSSSDSCGI